MEHCPGTVEGNANELADDVYDGEQHRPLPDHDAGNDGVPARPSPPQLQGR